MAPAGRSAAAARRATGTGSTALAQVVQPKLTIGASNDRYEREADDIARRVVASLAARESGDPTERQGGPAAPAVGRVQRRAPIGSAGGDLDADTEQRIVQARRGGSALPGAVRRSMGEAFGADFSGVRLHHGADSTELNDRIDAQAFTLGDDVFFRDGVPDTSSPDGQELLAHELTHTLQQRGGAAPATGAAIGRLQRRGGKRKNRNRRGGGRGNAGGGGAGGRRAPARVPEATVASAQSAFVRLAPFIDAAVPTAGDSSTIEASVKLPLDASGSTFLQFDLAGEAERDTDAVELGVDVAVGYGGAATLPFGLTPEIIGKLGGFVEAKSTTTAEVLALVSYGFYRQFRESGWMPREVADSLWGNGGGGATTGEAAEQWGADLERRIFARNDEASVTMGMYGAVEASLENGAEDELGVGVKLSTATKYSKESLSSSGTNGASQLGVAGKERNAGGWSSWLSSYFGRGEQKTVGEAERKLELSAEASSGALAGEASLEVALQRELEFTLEISGAGELGASERRPRQIAETIATFVASGKRLVEFLRARERSLAQYAGTLGDAADTIGGVIDAYATRKDELAAALEGKIGGKGVRAVKVGISIEREGGTTKSSLTVSYVSSYEAGAEALGIGVEASAERERKIVSFEWP